MIKENELLRKVLELELESLSVHELAYSTPSMSNEAFEALKESIDVNGQEVPVVTYRGKIVDGRHRYLALKQLGINTILTESLDSSISIQEVSNKIQIFESRRHASTSQLAIRAYRLKLSGASKTLSEASKSIGAVTKRVSEAKKIAETYGRLDILESIFNSEKFNTGTEQVPFMTDSLGTILRWLSENRSKSKDLNYNLSIEDEITEDEQAIANRFSYKIKNESTRTKKEIIKLIYADMQGEQI